MTVLTPANNKETDAKVLSPKNRRLNLIFVTAQKLLLLLLQSAISDTSPQGSQNALCATSK